MWPLPKIKATVVFCGGIVVPVSLIKFNFDIWFFFRRRGYDLKVVPQKLWGSIDDRSKIVAETVFKDANLFRYHLVAHSMGGLDARQFIHNNAEQPPLSLTTIATPHHGSPIADKYVHDKTASNNLEKSFLALTSIACAFFNKITPDDPNIRYFSFGSTDDSLVPVSSAAWGESCGLLEGSHIALVNPILFRGRYVWKETFKEVLDNLDREFG